MGVSHRDLELAALWLRWAAFLSYRDNAFDGFDMVICCTKRVAAAGGDRLLDAALGHRSGRTIRAEIFVHPDEQEHGYPGSASHNFLRTLECCEVLYPGSPVLWVESDTVPMRPSWFAEIAAEYQACGKPFMGMKVGTRAPHLSGNAVYPANWRKLAPTIAGVLQAPDVKEWGPGKGQPWDVWCRKETTPQMHETDLMFQIWKERDLRPTRIKDIPGKTALFHQDKTGALIREISRSQYPEFMESLTQGRRFFRLAGHPSRLRAKGHPIKFSFQRYVNHGWVCAVCSTEISDDEAQALTTIIGRLGLTEIGEEEFCKITGRKPDSIPAQRRGEVRANEEHSHPSVFVMLGRYGDICNILPMLHAEEQAGRRPTLVVSKDFADILDGVSYCDRIVWDGAYDQLPEALRWLRRDKGIAAPVVCQYHRNPYDKGRLTESYQSECWRLAGRLGNFAIRGPLVFDRRNTEREHAFEQGATMEGWKDGNPVVLLGLTSVSSPLPADVVMAITNDFQKNWAWHIVFLEGLRAERIYDLLGLFDRAALLISADTVFAHLARASKVPLIALTNTGWRGSVLEHAELELKYEGVIARPGMVLEAAQKLMEGKTDSEVRSPAITSKGPRLVTKAEADVLHVVHMHGDKPRHLKAQSTWKAAYDEGMYPVHCTDYARDSRTVLKETRQLPFLKDLLTAALERSTSDRDVICWTNSDIGFAPGAVEVIRHTASIVGITTMRRTESNGQPHMGRDLFAFTAAWLRANWDEFPDYILGSPAFDLGVAAMARKHCRCSGVTTMLNMAIDWYPADAPPGYALHESHVSEWLIPGHHAMPSVKWNQKLFVEWAKKYAPEIKFTKGGALK